MKRLPDNFRAYLLLRAVLFLADVPHGGKAAATKEAAESLGVATRTLYTWRRQFRQQGIVGLMRRRRSDRGRPRVLSPELLEAIRQRQAEMRGRGDLSKMWRSLGKPATFETFRFWLRQIQGCKVIELPSERTGGPRAASF